MESDVAPLPQPADGGSLRRALIILRRRWRLLAVVWLATVGGTAFFTLRQPKLYRAEVTLEVRPETPLVSAAGEDPFVLAGLWENYYRTQETILTSPALMKQTLKALPDAIRGEFTSLPDPESALAAQVEVFKERNSFILRVGVSDEVPATATVIVDTLVKSYLVDANSKLRGRKQEQADLLTKLTLPDIKKQMKEAEQNLREFMDQKGFIDAEVRHKTLVDEWQKIRVRLTDQKESRDRLRSDIRSLGDYKADGVSGAFHPTFQKTVEKLVHERSRLKEELVREGKTRRDQHPKIKQLQSELESVEKEIREAIEHTLTAMGKDLSSAEEKSTKLTEDEKILQAEIQSAYRDLSDYRKLDEECRIARDLYAAYLKQLGDASATSGSGLASVSVINPARVPLHPYKPRLFMNLAMGALMGLILGAGAMLAQDQLDNRILSPEEVEAFVGVQVLAAIPKLVEAEGRGDQPVLLGPDSSLAEFESFRGLRSGVVTQLEKVPGGRMLAVLSPMNQEGKSTVAVNLSRVLAMEGRRVLLFDADMRRPSIVPHFSVADGPCLEDVLSGAAPLEQAVRPSRIGGVDILGVRKGTSGAAELASSTRYDEVLQAVRGRYDYVIIDSAPVIQASESVLIARRADAAVLVLREGQSTRAAAKAAVKRLEGMQVRLLGSVLNCAVPHGAGYGYGYYYYSTYYGSEENTGKRA